MGERETDESAVRPSHLFNELKALIVQVRKGAGGMGHLELPAPGAGMSWSFSSSCVSGTAAAAVQGSGRTRRGRK